MSKDKKQKVVPLEEVQKEKKLIEFYNAVTEQPHQFDTFIHELEGYSKLAQNEKFAGKLQDINLCLLAFSGFILGLSSTLTSLSDTSEHLFISPELFYFFMAMICLTLISFANNVRKYNRKSIKSSAIEDRLNETSLRDIRYNSKLVSLKDITDTVVEAYLDVIEDTTKEDNSLYILTEDDDVEEAEGELTVEDSATLKRLLARQ